MEAVLTTFEVFVQALEEFCKSEQSGCAFFTSTDNHAGRIIVSAGQITNMTYARQTGSDALESMTEISRVKYRFDPTAVNMPLDSTLPTTEMILRKLASIDEPVAGSVVGATLTAQMSRVMEDSLTEIIGPMAAFICEDHLYNAKSESEAISAIMREIDPDEASEFKLLYNEKMKEQ